MILQASDQRPGRLLLPAPEEDNTPVEVVLLSERNRVGRIRRFDKYALVLEVDGREEMIYKHAIASVSPLVAPRTARPAPVPRRYPERARTDCLTGSASGRAGRSAAIPAACTRDSRRARRAARRRPGSAGGTRSRRGAFAFRDPAGFPPVGSPPPMRRGIAKGAQADLGVRPVVGTAGRQERFQAKRRKGEPVVALLAGSASVYVGSSPRGTVEAAPVRSWTRALTCSSPDWIAGGRGPRRPRRDPRATPRGPRAYRTLAFRLAPKDKRARGRVETLRAQLAAERRLEAEAALGSGDVDAARRAAHSLLQSSRRSRGPRSSRPGRRGRRPESRTPGPGPRKRGNGLRPTSPLRLSRPKRRRRRGGGRTPPASTKASPRPTRLRAEGRGGEGRVQGAEPSRGGASRGGIGAPDPRAARHPPLVDGPRVSGRARSAGCGDRSRRRRSVRPGAAREGDRARFLRRLVRDPSRRSGLDRLPDRDGRGPAKGRAPGGPWTPAKGCLAFEPPTPAHLSECGILSYTPSRNVTGREALRALEKAARLGREGGTR